MRNQHKHNYFIMIVDLTSEERSFAVLISSLHAIQHVFYRLVPPLIPILAVDLDSPLWQLGLLVSVHMFVGGLFQAPFGELSDRIDRQYLAAPSIGAMATGYVIFAAAPTASSILPSIEVFGRSFTGTFQLMTLSMIVSGIGYSVVHPVGYPLISSNVSSDNKGKVLGMWGSASKIGDALASILVGGLLLIVSWRWILVLISACGYVYAVWLFVSLRNPQFDTQPSSRNKSDTSNELNRTLLNSDPRRFILPVLILLVFFFAILFAGNGLLAFAPAFVVEVYGFSYSFAGVTVRSESVANVYFALLLLSATISQLGTGALADRYDHRAVILLLLGVSTVCLLFLSLFVLTPITLLIVFVILGSCLFGVNPVRDALISDVTPQEYEGRTFGYVYTVALVGSSAFPTVIGYLGDIIGLRSSFRYLAAGTLLGILAVLALYSSRIYKR